MGRSPKPEANEPKPQAPEPPPSAAQPRPPAAYAPQTQNTSAAQAYEQPARTAPPAATAAPSTPRAVTESEALARDLRDGVVSGFIGGGTVVSGDAEFKGMLRIDGHFTGRVRSEKGSLIVSAGGVVDADVAVATAKINGTVNGDIVATERIEFGRSARVRGDIQTPALVIEEGAVFEGACRMQPKPEAARTPKAEAPRASPAPPQARQPAAPAAPPVAANAAAAASSPEPTA
ncbi:MAG TPA: polymer-forming cytoskeletal protein [Pyrinomonadaceae bacterium]|jgi:cytoskeletal protein CcmA (bactofilin family)